MFNKERGMLYAAKKLATFVSNSGLADGKYEINQYPILNTNDQTAIRLTGEFSNEEQRTRKDILTKEYGINPNPLILFLVRLIAFSMIKNKNSGLSWYESPMLGTIKDRQPKSI